MANEVFDEECTRGMLKNPCQNCVSSLATIAMTHLSYRKIIIAESDSSFVNFVAA